jgi:Na+-transporting NADH:ubiquinone oxidoreductase subunit NqrC
MPENLSLAFLLSLISLCSLFGILITIQKKKKRNNKEPKILIISQVIKHKNKNYTIITNNDAFIRSYYLKNVKIFYDAPKIKRCWLEINGDKNKIHLHSPSELIKINH